LQQLDWNGSNVGYVVVKLSIHLQSTKFFLSRMCTAYSIYHFGITIIMNYQY